MGESKQQALQRLYANYTDYYGMVTLYNSSLSHSEQGLYDSENQHLWSGEAAILIQLNDLGRPLKLEQGYEGALVATRATIDSKPVFGLYSRHPDPFRFSKDFHAVSLDEYNGILYYTSTRKGEMDYIAHDILAYGEKNAFAYIDEAPNTNPLKEAKEQGVWTTIKQIYDYLKNKRESKVVEHLSRIRLPRDVAFYRIMAGESPKFLEMTHLVIASILSSFTSPEDTGGKLLTYFRYRAMNNKGYNNIILNLSEKIFTRQLRKQYGEYYLSELIKIYFKDEHHPFHTLAEGIK